MAVRQTQKNPSAIELMEELQSIAGIIFPILVTAILNYLKNVISVACMGRVGSIELAGGALAIGFTNITGYSVLSSLAMGMEPLCSQAFGSKNSIVVSQTLQRMIILLLTTSVPIGMLWINLEPIMLWLHQEHQVVHFASLYCKFAVPDLIVNSLFHPLRIHLRCKGITWPLLFCTFLSTLLHFPITIFLTFNHHLGIQGIAISTFISNLNTLLFLFGYINFTQDEKMRPYTINLTLKTSHWKEWAVLLQLAIPSCLSVCLEWWWYEIMTLLAGYLNKPQVSLATSAIVIQTTSLMYTLLSSLSASVSTRVGNELGAGKPDKARLATTVAITLAFSAPIFGLFLTTLGRGLWASVFTDDIEVLDLMITVLPIIGLCELANCPQTTCCGVLRGSARPGVGVGINFCSFYLLGTPVAIALAFFAKIGFSGLCYGLLAAQLACLLLILVAVCRTDWETESLRAKELVGESNKCEYQDLGAKCDGV